MEELGLEDEDLMNVEQKYNIGLKNQVGWNSTNTSKAKSN